MDLMVVMESQLVDRETNIISDYSFIEPYLISNIYSHYCGSRLSDPKNIHDKFFSVSERLMKEWLPKKLKKRKLTYKKIEKSELESALSFCWSGGLKNKDLKNRIIKDLHNIGWGFNQYKNEQEFENDLPQILKKLSDLGQSCEDLDRGRKIIESEIFPFKNSPISSESISTMLNKSSAKGLGAYIGYLIIEPSPLLLLTMPVGMILFGAAYGVASGLEEGLRQKIKDCIYEESRKIDYKNNPIKKLGSE